MYAESLDKLTKREKIYKEMYRKYPNLHLDHPKTLKELLKQTIHLPENQNLGIQTIPTQDNLTETTFPAHMDVTANRHERYCPCFFHSHDFFEISYVIKGNCTNYMPGQILHMKTGDLSLMSLQTIHAISVFDDDTIVINLLLRASTFKQTFFGILTHKDVISSFFARALYTQETEAYLFFNTGNDEQVRHLFLEIYEESHAGQNYAERMLTTLVTELFIHLLRRHQQNLTISNPSGHNADRNIIFILNYMMANFKTLSLKSLSTFFGYSERQMARILKEYTGKTFTTIIQDIRIQKACELLQNPELPIPEVIEAVGYSNLNHFYAVFKKQHAMTPAAYREHFLAEHRL